MEYPYPAARGVTPWDAGWRQGPTASPAGMSPWAGKQAAPWADKQAAPWAGKQATPWAGKQATPWAGKQATPWADKQAAPWAGKQAAPWAGKQATPWATAPGGYAKPQAGYWPEQAGYPAQVMPPGPMPQSAGPMYMSEPFPATGGFQKGQAIDPMMGEFSSMLVPALNSVLPAIQGLLQIPALLMEFGESANVLSRWGDLQVMLTPAEEPNPAQMAIAETDPLGSGAEMTAEAPRDEAPTDGDETRQV